MNVYDAYSYRNDIKTCWGYKVGFAVQYNLFSAVCFKVEHVTFNGLTLGN